MVVLRSQKVTGSSSSSSSLDVCKRFRSGVGPVGPKAKPRKTSKDPRDLVRPYATDAMKFYNKQTGTKYELVKPGFITSVLLATCVLHHMDFTAKKTGVADAPEEMFFAELTTLKGVRCVTLCESMGPKNAISGDKNNGCLLCKFHNVQHPRGGGFTVGGADLFRCRRE